MTIYAALWEGRENKLEVVKRVNKDERGCAAGTPGWRQAPGERLWSQWPNLGTSRCPHESYAICDKSQNPRDFDSSGFGLALLGNCPKRVHRLLSGLREELLPSGRAELLNVTWLFEPRDAQAVTRSRDDSPSARVPQKPNTVVGCIASKPLARIFTDWNYGKAGAASSQTGNGKAFWTGRRDRSMDDGPTTWDIQKSKESKEHDAACWIDSRMSLRTVYVTVASTIWIDWRRY